MVFARRAAASVAAIVSGVAVAACTLALEPESEPTPAPAPQAPTIPEGELLLWSGDVNGTVVVPSGEDGRVTKGGFVGYEISPDGSSVIATREERLSTGISYNPELVTIDTRTGDRETLGRTRAREEFGGPVHWSPDGTRVAYRLVRYPTDPSRHHPAAAPGRVEESLTVCTLALDQPEPRCFPEAGRVFEFDWTPDGHHLVLTGPGPRPMQLLHVATGRIRVMLSLDDRRLDAILHGPGRDDPVQFTSPRWSPSGGYLAALVNAPASVPMIFTRGGRPLAAGRSALGNAYGLAWAPEADVLYYTTGYDIMRDGAWSLRSLDPVTGEDVVVARARFRPLVTGFAISPTGRWLALTDSTSTIRFIDLQGHEPTRSLHWHSQVSLEDWGVEPQS